MAADCQSHSVFLPVYFPLSQTSPSLYLYLYVCISLPVSKFPSIYLFLYLSQFISILINLFMSILCLWKLIFLSPSSRPYLSLSLSYSASILSLIIFRSVGNSTYDQSIALSILLFRQCFVPPADYHLLYLICSYQQFTLSHTTSPSTETKAPTLWAKMSQFRRQ